MKKVSLNIGERLTLANLLNTYSKDLTLSSYRTALKIMDKIEISDVEKEKVKLKVDIQNNKISWEDMKYAIDVELSNDEATFIDSIFGKMDTEKKFSITQGKEIVTLIDKMEGTKDEK